MPGVLRFNYMNHSGKLAGRTILPKSIEFHRKPGYGYQPGWFLTGFDLDKNAMRSFALTRISLDDNESPSGVFRLLEIEQ